MFAPLTFVVAFLLAPAASSQASKGVVDLGLQEKVQVRLSIIDAVVLDRRDRAVSGLSAEDFEVTVRGREIPITSVDVDCTGEGAVASHASRKLVLALDYQHLDVIRRAFVLDQAERIVERAASGGTEIMVVALTGGLRVEQPFDGDPQRTLATLQRMNRDVTLSNGNFHHESQDGFMDGMTEMFDLLGEVPGSKAVMLFSAMREVPLERQFKEIAAQAAGARCAVYTVDVRGLTEGDLGLTAARVSGVLGPKDPTPYQTPFLTAKSTDVASGCG